MTIIAPLKVTKADRPRQQPVIEALKQALTAGEIDQRLTTAGAEVSLRFAKLMKR